MIATLSLTRLSHIWKHGNLRVGSDAGGAGQLANPSMGLPYATIPGPAHAFGLRIENGGKGGQQRSAANPIPEHSAT